MSRKIELTESATVVPLIDQEGVPVGSMTEMSLPAWDFEIEELFVIQGFLCLAQQFGGGCWVGANWQALEDAINLPREQLPGRVRLGGITLIAGAILGDHIVTGIRLLYDRGVVCLTEGIYQVSGELTRDLMEDLLRRAGDNCDGEEAAG